MDDPSIEQEVEEEEGDQHLQKVKCGKEHAA